RSRGGAQVGRGPTGAQAALRAAGARRAHKRARSPRSARAYDHQTPHPTPDLEAALQEIRIPNQATYSPVSLTDVLVAAPPVPRPLLGATLPGRVLQLAALGAYAGSALQAWTRRQGVRKIDFLREFGADVRNFELMPDDARRQEARVLV